MRNNKNEMVLPPAGPHDTGMFSAVDKIHGGKSYLSTLSEEEIAKGEKYRKAYAAVSDGMRELAHAIGNGRDNRIIDVTSEMRQFQGLAPTQVKVKLTPAASRVSSKRAGRYVDDESYLEAVFDAIKAAKGWATLDRLLNAVPISRGPLQRVLDKLVADGRIKTEKKKHNPAHKNAHRSYGRTSPYYVVV